MEDAKLRKISESTGYQKKSIVGAALMVTRCPAVPPELNEVAAAFWQKKCVQLIKMGRLFESDLEGVAQMCMIYSDVVRTREAMDKCWGSEMYLKWQKAHNEAHKLFVAMLKEFGLTPYSKGKLKGVPVEKEKDDFDSFDDEN